MNTISSLSIYIPRIHSKHTEEDIRQKFTRVGFVSRVDFTPINKRHGFYERIDEVFKSAFVHFSELEEFSALRHVIENGNSYKIYLDNSDEYWMCYKNIHPIPSTMMNIHQVVENCNIMENIIEGQEQKIKEQEETINEISKKLGEMSKKLEGVYTVVYQLTGGLYCQRTQMESLENNLVFLGLERIYKDVEDEHRWTYWPTTRQGDENERRLDELEKTVKNIVENVLDIEEDEIEDSNLYKRKMERCSERNNHYGDSMSLDTQDDHVENCQTVDHNGSIISELSDEIKNSYDLCDRE